MWEYKILVEWVSDYGVQDSIETLNEYGKEDWELAQIVNGHIILKRKSKSHELYSTVIKYLKENDIRTYEDVYESNKIENTATALVDELLSIVKDDLDLEDDE